MISAEYRNRLDADAWETHIRNDVQDFETFIGLAEVWILQDGQSLPY